jgi:MraZ protein
MRILSLLLRCGKGDRPNQGKPSFMTLFLATHLNKLDQKGRVSIPASFRAALSVSSQDFQGVILVPSHQYPALEGFSYAAMQELSARLDHFALFSSDQDDLAAMLFGSAVPCPFDETGRIVLPKSLIDHVGLRDQVAFVGMGKKFQVWAPQRLEQRTQAARQAVQDLGLVIPASPAGARGPLV